MFADVLNADPAQSIHLLPSVGSRKTMPLAL
jgi:hypothetical protein